MTKIPTLVCVSAEPERVLVRYVFKGQLSYGNL